MTFQRLGVILNKVKLLLKLKREKRIAIFALKLLVTVLDNSEPDQVIITATNTNSLHSRP